MSCKRISKSNMSTTQLELVRSRRTPVPLLIAALLLTGCQSFIGAKLNPVGPATSAQTLLIDGDGRLRASYDPVSRALIPGAPLGTDAVRRVVSRVMDSIASHRARGERILLYMHGGKTSAEQKRAESVDLIAAMRTTDPGTYPVFILWDSPAFPTYFEHMHHHAGDRTGRGLGALLGPPTTVLADFTRALGAVPMNLGHLASEQIRAMPEVFTGQRQIRHSVDLDSVYSLVQTHKAMGVRRQGQARMQDGRAIVDTGGFRASVWSKTTRTALLLPRLPARIALGGPLDALGSPMYSQMTDRVTVAFRNYRAGSYYAASGGDTMSADGPMTIFLDSLQERFGPTLAGEGCIKVIAHSMGTIFANELLAHWTDLPVDTVVYMAGAATLRETRDGVGAWLLRDTSRRFYNLVLHPEAERRESNLLGLVPTGTLLVWIDDYFAAATTPIDRTVGQFRNTAAFLSVLPEEVQPQVVVKMFGYRDRRDAARRDDGSQSPCYNGISEHGDFSNPELRFWEAGFYLAREGRDAVACPHLEREHNRSAAR
jgi:hypothetical protein